LRPRGKSWREPALFFAMLILPFRNDRRGPPSGNLILLALGRVSVIELASAGVLICRPELHREKVFFDRTERIAGRRDDASRLVLLAGNISGAVCSLCSRDGEFLGSGADHLIAGNTGYNGIDRVKSLITAQRCNRSMGLRPPEVLPAAVCRSSSWSVCR
jgi:hypothetical protein